MTYLTKAQDWVEKGGYVSRPHGKLSSVGEAEQAAVLAFARFLDQEEDCKHNAYHTTVERITPNFVDLRCECKELIVLATPDGFPATQPRKEECACPKPCCDPGFHIPLPTPKEAACEHSFQGFTRCQKCGSPHPKEPDVEELKTGRTLEIDGNRQLADLVVEIGNKLNEVIRALNKLSK